MVQLLYPTLKFDLRSKHHCKFQHVTAQLPPTGITGSDEVFSDFSGKISSRTPTQKQSFHNPAGM